MTRIIAIDPGSRMSGWCEVTGPEGLGAFTRPKVGHHATLLNKLVVAALMIAARDEVKPKVGLEAITPQQTMGASTIDTACALGGFVALAKLSSFDVVLVTRGKVLKHFSVKRGPKADSELRRAIIERYGQDEAEALGTREHPGPLHGVANHQWSALAIGLLLLDNPGAGEAPTW